MSLHVHHPDYRRRPGRSGGRARVADDPLERCHGEGPRGRRIREAREGGSSRHRRHLNIGTRGSPWRPTSSGSTSSEVVSPGPAIVTAQAEGFGPEFREVNGPEWRRGGGACHPTGKAEHTPCQGRRPGRQARRRRLLAGRYVARARLVAQGRGSDRGCMAIHLERSNRCRRALHLDKCPERRHALPYL